METNTNNPSIIIGSVKQVLDMRIILGDQVSTGTVVLFNSLNRSLDYCIAQYNMGHTEYSTKINNLQILLLALQASCPSICNYRTSYPNSGIIDGGVFLIDFRSSNATTSIDTTNIKISELTITQ
tara:strand:- start:4864 stop:5238 length:375 start_codon:yes stop_codon:yes gene_type:complete